MFDVNECIPEQTVLVDEDNAEFLYLGSVARRLFVCTSLKNGYDRLYHSGDCENWTIKPQGLDPSTLVPGVTKLKDETGGRYVFLALYGEVMFAANACLVPGQSAFMAHVYSKPYWSKWTKVDDDH